MEKYEENLNVASDAKTENGHNINTKVVPQTFKEGGNVHRVESNEH